MIVNLTGPKDCIGLVSKVFYFCCVRKNELRIKPEIEICHKELDPYFEQLGMPTFFYLMYIKLFTS